MRQRRRLGGGLAGHLVLLGGVGRGGVIVAGVGVVVSVSCCVLLRLVQLLLLLLLDVEELELLLHLLLLTFPLPLKLFFHLLKAGAHQYLYHCIATQSDTKMLLYVCEN